MNQKASRLFEIVIEVPRWGFVKRGAGDQIEFISPLPCPYNYGAIPEYLGMDGDLLDAVVLGPRRPRGTRLKLRAYGVIGFTDRGLYDDKLICAERPLTAAERARVLTFFRIYALFKRVLNFLRGRRGLTCCEGWRDVDSALSRAQVRNGKPRRPLVAF